MQVLSGLKRSTSVVFLVTTEVRNTAETSQNVNITTSHGHRYFTVESKNAVRPGRILPVIPALSYYTLYIVQRPFMDKTTHLRELHTNDLSMPQTTHLMPIPEPATNQAPPHNYYPNGAIRSPNAFGPIRVTLNLT